MGLAFEAQKIKKNNNLFILFGPGKRRNLPWLFIKISLKWHNIYVIAVWIFSSCLLYLATCLSSFRTKELPLAQMVKNLPAVQETQVPFPESGRSPEKGTATHYNILAWRIPWNEEPGGLQSMGLQGVRHD